MADLSIMYQPIAGGWVKLGTQTGGGRGVAPQSIRLEGDRGEGGCLSAQFTLKQDPRWINTELQAYTPIAVWDGAECIWSGRTIMAPTTFGEDDVEVVVQCQGWWQHLKDDCTDREWVVADLSRWADMRSQPGANLSKYKANGIANTGAEIYIGWEAQAIINTGNYVGAVIDLGPNSGARAFSIDYTSSNNWGSGLLYVIGNASTIDVDGTGALFNNNGGATNIVNSAGASGTFSGTFASPARYVGIVFYANGTLAPPTVDVFFKITGARLFTDSADVSAGASILKASTVISETLDAIAPKISRDRSRITTTALNLPQFPGAPGWRYGHELIQQANAPHGYVARLTPDPVPVFEYFPTPTDYRFVVGEGDYTLIEPAAQDGQLVYSRIISEYEDAAGVRGYASSITQPTRVSAAQLSNPSFDTNTTGWIATAGSITRDTGVFDTSPASLRITSTAGGAWGFQSPFATGAALEAGRTYRLAFRWRRAATTGTVSFLLDGQPDYLNTSLYTTINALLASTALNTWVEVAYDFVSNGSAPYFNVLSTSAGALSSTIAYIDTVEIREQDAHIVARRGFNRTALRPMTHRSTAATAQAIADLELAAAKYPPFKGTITVTGSIPLKGGGSMDVSHLPALTGENILIKNLHDPNTQALGRLGNITSAVYDHDKQTVMIGIDRDLRFISQLRSRLEIVSR